MSDLSTPEGRTARAEELVGAKPAELAQWAHDGKVALISRALAEAYEAGRKEVVAVASLWLQCNQCGHGHWVFTDEEDGRACPHCGYGKLSVSEMK